MNPFLRKLFFLPLVLLFLKPAWAQENDSLLSIQKYLHQEDDSLTLAQRYPFIVDSITISGNKITEEDIILRELTFNIGDTLSYRLATYNEERIFSLDIFSRVKFNPEIIDNRNILRIFVEESWYIYPIPFVDIQDGDWNKLSYGISLVIKNFRGRNEELSVRTKFGYDPAYSISYYKPSIIRKSNIFFEIASSYSDISNISTTAKKLSHRDFTQKAAFGQVLIGNRFGLFQKLSLNLNYNYIETPFYIKGISASDGRVDQFPSTGIIYSYDTRDLIQFPKNGFFFETNIQWKGLGVNDINYGTLNFDYREYKQIIGDLHAKLRMATRFTIGKQIPYYDYSYLGYAERIRGHFTEKREGVSSYVGSIETYYPIIKDLHISFEWVPLLPNELLRFRVALYAQIFGDTGGIKEPGKSLTIRSFYSGCGAGLTFLLLPYNSLRLEYAYDEYGNGEFIVNFGISF